MPDDEITVSPSNLSDAANGKTDTIVVTRGQQGGRKVRGQDLPAVLQQAGVKKDWKGTLVVAFPDVCKTPSPGGPVPIPYPSISTEPANGKKVNLKEAIYRAGFKSVTVASLGDEPGVMGAKAHTKGAFTGYSFDVKAEGKHLLGHELTHTVQQSHAPHIVPSQTKVIVTAP